METEYPIETSQLIVTKTDIDGIITHANPVFCEISGYEKSELLGENHNIVRHADMPRIVFKLLWTKILDGQEIVAFVKNRRKDGQYYWVFATVNPTTDKSGEIDGFISVRKAANRKAIAQIIPLYQELKAREDDAGYGQAGVFLKELLESKKIKFNVLMRALQRGEQPL